MIDKWYSLNLMRKNFSGALGDAWSHVCSRDVMKPWFIQCYKSVQKLVLIPFGQCQIVV